MTFSDSSAHLRRVGEMSIPSWSITQSASRSGDLRHRHADQLLARDRGRGLGDRAALSVEAQVGDPPLLVHHDVHAQLVAAERVEVVELEVVRLERAEVPRVLVVVEDEVAVEGVHRTELEDLARLVERVHQPVDVLARVVDVEAGARGRGHAQLAHQRLGAVVAGADADALAVAQLGDVVGVHARQLERDHAAAPVGVRRAEDPQALDLRQALERVGREVALVGAHPLHPDLGQVVDRRAQSDALGDRRGAGLELPRQLVPGGGVEVDARDHVAAAEERPHRLEQLAAAVQHADAGGAECLVAGPGVEVGAELVGASTGIWGTAWAASTSVTAPAARARSTISRTGLIVPSTFETCATATSFTRPSASTESSSSSDSSPCSSTAQVAQPRAALLAEELPGDDVRVVLHLGDEHLVALAHVLAAPGVGDQVDRLGHVAGEDRGAGLPAHEGGDPLARALEQLGGLARQRVDAAVDVGVGVAVVGVDRPDHLAPASARWRRSRGRRSPPASSGKSERTSSVSATAIRPPRREPARRRARR